MRWMKRLFDLENWKKDNTSISTELVFVQVKNMQLHLTDMIRNVHYLQFIPQQGYWDSPFMSKFLYLSTLHN